jgi:hypothetical protein
MATISLKLTNIQLYPGELLKRLRGVNSHGKAKLVSSIKNENWEAVYSELLYRFELYTQAKVLNYPKQTVIATALMVKKAGLEKITTQLMKKVESNVVLNESEKMANDYSTFFKEKLEEYGVSSPAELSKEDKTKFFAEIEKQWTGQKN